MFDQFSEWVLIHPPTIFGFLCFLGIWILGSVLLTVFFSATDPFLESKYDKIAIMAIWPIIIPSFIFGLVIFGPFILAYYVGRYIGKNWLGTIHSGDYE